MPPLTAANHAIRAVNVTASEVGALLGEHPYMTPGNIYDRLLGSRQVVPTLAMEFGSAAEPILKRMAERALGSTIRMNSKTYQHPRVHLCATPDATIHHVASPFGAGQVRDIVEFKTSWSQNRWRDGLPPDIEWQVRAQLACTHRQRAIVYVFCGVEKVYTVTRERNRENRMTQAVERFWQEHWLPRIRPEEVKAEPDYTYRVTKSKPKARAS